MDGLHVMIEGYGKGFTQFAQALTQFWISLLDII